MVINRLNRFVTGTMRGRYMVKGIRLKKDHYNEYKDYLKLLNRYPVEKWDEELKSLYFMGIPIYRHPWL